MTKKVYFINLDLETGGFNSMFKGSDGTYKHGAKEFPILQLAFTILDSETLETLTTFDLAVTPIDGIKEWSGIEHLLDPSTDNFHKGLGYTNYWESRDPILTSIVELRAIEAIRSFLVGEGVISEGTTIPPYSHLSPATLVLMGKSVHFDRDFLNMQMPALSSLLSHQHADVSAVSALMTTPRRGRYKLSTGTVTHRALDDTIAAKQDAIAIRRALNAYSNTGGRSLEEKVQRAVDTENARLSTRIKKLIAKLLNK